MKNKNSVSLLARRVSLTLCTAIIAVASSNSAQAQNWRFEPIVRVGGEYDDNATLSIRTDQEVDATGYLVDLKADINYTSNTNTFFLQPRALIKNYPDETVFDSDDLFLRSEFRHEGQSNDFGFRVKFEEEATRTAERAVSDIDIDDPDDIGDDESGEAVLFGTRTKWQISPYWDYQLSDISSIGAAVNYYDVQYDDQIANRLADYSDARLNLNYRRKFSNVNTALLTVTTRNYDADDAFDDITGYGLMAGFENALSQKTRLRAMVGFEQTEQYGFSSDTSPTGFINISRNLETIRMFAQYRRSVSASGAGRLTARDSLNINFRRRLSEKMSAGLGVRAYQTKGIGDETPVDDRDYVQLHSSFLWYLSRALIVEAEYRYTVNDRSAAVGERANSNQINLWFAYQPKTIPKY
ncbi:MAG: hypothetical protein ACR2RD_15755 [Woeseiaceae bacterium]